jgi:hypothetical protein
MRAKVPMTLEIDNNNITKLKQRILVWAASQPDYVANNVPIKLLVKNLDQIYSGNYRALSSVSKEEARTLMLPAWLDKRIKETSIKTKIRPEKLKQVKGRNNNSGSLSTQESPAKMETYKIPRKKHTLTRNVSESSISHDEDNIRKKDTPSKGPKTKTSNNTNDKERDPIDVIRIVDKTNTETWPPYTESVQKKEAVIEEENFISQLTMDSNRIDIEEDIQLSQDSLKASEEIHDIPEIPEETTKSREVSEAMNNAREVEESRDESLNDTPGKDLATQVAQYNMRINQDSPDYGDSPIQEQQEGSSQYQDSDEDFDEEDRRHLLAVRNRLFYQAALGTGNNEQQQGKSGDGQRGTEHGNTDKRDQSNPREDPQRDQGGGQRGSGNNNNNNNRDDKPNDKPTTTTNVTQDTLEELESALDDQESDSSDYDDEIVYQTLKRIKPYTLTETERYNDRYTTTKCSPPPRAPLTGNYPEMILEVLERCRPNPEWDTVYNPVSSIQVMKLE